MKDKTRKSQWCRFVSFEYCEDNYYIDYENGFIYESEDIWKENHRGPVPSIDIEECGELILLGNADQYDLADFIEETYPKKEYPEYYV